jgi:4-hydroxy-2-oxoheptanedioate aldolase
MEPVRNLFKQRLKAGQSQIGLWCSLANGYAAEVVAGSGFDWLLLDTEHAPGGIDSVLHQMQAAAPYPVSTVVRPDVNDTVLIKRYLDIGAQTLLIPYVQTPDEARAAVAAMRYPPLGVRGVGGTTRATRFGRVKGYAAQASDDLCLLVQVETAEAMAQLEAIATVDGVDGVFIGPNDLAASLGRLGNPGHPEVIAAIEDIIVRLKTINVPSGILTPDAAFARRCIALGTTFTAVGSDIGILARGTEALASAFRA